MDTAPRSLLEPAVKPNDAPLLDRRARLDSVAAAFADRRLARLVRAESTRRLLGTVQNEAFLRHSDTRYQLLVGSAAFGEGRTSIALALAACAAAIDPKQKVLYVEADPARPALLDRIGSMYDGPGYFDYLEGDVTDFNACVQPFVLNNLFVVPAGGGLVGWRRIVASRVEAFAADARARFGAVFYDGPAYASGAELITLARVLREVLLVVRFRGPYREQVQRLLDDLRIAEANVLGTVLNRRVFPVPGWLYRR